MKRLLIGALAGLFLATAAYAGGMFQGYPAATTVTGAECIPGDTNLSQGRTPQTECFSPTLLLAGSGATALTDGATINSAITGNNVFTVTLGGNRTMANPTGANVGARVLYVVTQDGTGSRTVTWGTMFGWAGGTAPTLTTTAAHYDVITCTVISSTVMSCAASLDVHH